MAAIVYISNSIKQSCKSLHVTKLLKKINFAGFCTQLYLLVNTCGHYTVFNFANGTDHYIVPYKQNTNIHAVGLLKGSSINTTDNK